MRIDTVAMADGPFERGIFGRGGRHFVDSAARTCLDRAQCEPEELELLVSVGIYKDHGLAEPAFASLVQEDIGANRGAALHEAVHGHGTFSFDLMNGGCGVLSALHVLDGFLAGGLAQNALVVAADVEPKFSERRGFPYVASAGALLLRAGGPDHFVRFLFRTFPEYASLFDARVAWDADRERNLIVVDEEVAYAWQCRRLAASVARELLTSEGRSASDVDLVIASQYPRRFPLDLAAGLELSPHVVPPVEAHHVASHTAGPIAALDAAVRSGRFESARRILFVTVGAGISVGAALYERTAAG